MDKTIEERALAFAKSCDPLNENITMQAHLNQGYIKGATDQSALMQKEIDELKEELENIREQLDIQERHYKILPELDAKDSALRECVEALKDGLQWVEKTSDVHSCDSEKRMREALATSEKLLNQTK